ncbi:MAG TPA: phenylalanine--tRNA ligase subunit beta [Solirubrobacteraceae bacterium]|jgi:phenylalanyl-tRNA synthetase beta chain
MRVPLNWLRAFCAPDLDVRALAERLALTGTEVDRIHTHGVAALERFVVGRVLTAERHPDADRLSVCTVAIGEGDVATIVCGAPNVAAGQTVAVAQPGAIMPDGTKLKKAKLRGVPSEGMILAEDEVGIGTDHDGIMVLDDDLVPGTPLEDVLPLTTEVLELEITPNRPDCLAIYGVAREVHAATGAPLAPPPWADDPGRAGDVEGIEVVVEAPDLCPRFTARRFDDVELGPSPAWLKARLMAAGQRPINNVVDITNYVMLETGQPLHAFDLDRVAGGRLVVRRARAGETMTTLDDVERTLDEDVCLIADADGPTSIAGLMGGARSEVAPTTTRVLMEAANWDGPNLQRTSTRLGLRTEASSRFEKQLAPEQTLDGQALATKLMIELCGARPVGGTVDVGGPGPAPAVIRLRDARVSGLLGAPVERSESAGVLERLDFGVAEAADGLDVTVPAFRRNDVSREADLIEEVARLAVLERLPATLPSRRGASGRLSVAQRLRRRAEDALIGAGLSEIVGWSFVSPQLPALLGLDGDGALVLENPMSEEQSVMRTTLVGSLLDAAQRNRARGAGAVRVFEVGSVYLPGEAGPEPRLSLGAGTHAARGQAPDASTWQQRNAAELPPLPDEHLHAAVLLTGAVRPATWGDPEPPQADFFAAKGVLEAMLGALRVEFELEPGGAPFLHPGRAARVLIDGKPAGGLGEIHPQVAARWDLGRTAGFELDLDAVTAAAVSVPAYRDLTSFPSVRQDLAVIVGDDVPAAEVLRVVRAAGGALLAAVEVFDVYRGEQVGAGRASLALRLEFRASDRTLTDEEVAARRGKIVAALRDQLGGELRG